ncbi:ester cyclase [Jatrophihabitans sp. YIM 134969]
MSTIEDNKKVAREYIERVFNEHRPDRSADYVTPDVVWHGGVLGTVAGADNVGNLLTGFIGALPDLHAAEQDVIAEGDLVTVRLVVTATQQGDLLGVPASGRQIRWDAVDIYRVRDGRISEEWAADDMAAICYQLGVFTPPWLG